MHETSRKIFVMLVHFVVKQILEIETNPRLEYATSDLAGKVAQIRI
jgi:hypothetical protein